MFVVTGEIKINAHIGCLRELGNGNKIGNEVVPISLPLQISVRLWKCGFDVVLAHGHQVINAVDKFYPLFTLQKKNRSKSMLIIFHHRPPIILKLKNSMRCTKKIQHSSQTHEIYLISLTSHRTLHDFSRKLKLHSESALKSLKLKWGRDLIVRGVDHQIYQIRPPRQLCVCERAVEQLLANYYIPPAQESWGPSWGGGAQIQRLLAFWIINRHTAKPAFSLRRRLSLI